MVRKTTACQPRLESPHKDFTVFLLPATLVSMGRGALPYTPVDTPSGDIHGRAASGTTDSN